MYVVSESEWPEAARKDTFVHEQGHLLPKLRARQGQSVLSSGRKC